MLSVPVQHDSSTLIQDARIDYAGRWVDKHIRTVELAYRKAPHFSSFAGEYFSILRQMPLTIPDLNIALCTWAMAKLGIATRTMKSCELGVAGDKFRRPLIMLERLGATEYLSGPAARPYTDEAAFSARGIGLAYKRYRYPPYPQLHGGFVPDVSVIDLLFNCGPDSRRYLKSLEPNEMAVSPPGR